MNNRIKKLRCLVLELAHDCYRNNKYIGSVMNEENKKLPFIIRKALAFKKAAECMPIFIQDGELIIGGRTIFQLPKHHTEKEIEESRLSNNNNLA